MNKEQRRAAVLDYLSKLRKGDTIRVKRTGYEGEQDAAVHLLDSEDPIMPVAIGSLHDWEWLDSEEVVLPTDAGKSLKDIHPGALIRLDSSADESSVTGTVVSVNEATQTVSLSFARSAPIPFDLIANDKITVLKESPKAEVTINVGELEATLTHLLKDDTVEVKRFMETILRQANK